MPRNQNAGEAIAEGGYGCVFKPPIKCKNATVPYDPTGVSKLMTKYAADNEMREIKDIKPIISTIPNNQRYFLIDKINLCSPDKLTDQDKKNFDKKCNNMAKIGINSINVNNKLNQLKIINIPYGGKDLNGFRKEREEYADAASRSTLLSKTYQETLNKSFTYTNYALIDLLKNGIVEMNKRGLYHCDIKAANILRDGILKSEHPKVRLIDWGSVTIHKPDYTYFPSIVSVIQFNVPFSNILFNYEAGDLLRAKLDKIKNSFALVNNQELGKKAIMRTIAIQILADTFKLHGAGHREYVKYILNSIYQPLLTNVRPKISLTNSLEYTFNTDIIVDYLTEVLTHYVVKNEYGVYKFKTKKYLEEVYLKNVDIWGFLMSYLSFLKIKKEWNLNYSAYSAYYDWSDKLTNSIMRIILEYCYNPKYAVRPIPVDKVIEDLKQLNTSYVLGVDVPRPKTPVLRIMPSAPKAVAATITTVAPKKTKVCPPGKEINPKTGRCINIKKPKATRKTKPAAAKAAKTAKPIVTKKTKKIILKPASKTKAKTLKVKKVSASTIMKANAGRKMALNQPFTWPKTRNCPKGAVKSKVPYPASAWWKYCQPK